MAQSIGLVVTEHVALGSGRRNLLSGELRVLYGDEALHGMPADEMLQTWRTKSKPLAGSDARRCRRVWRFPASFAAA